MNSTLNRWVGLLLILGCLCAAASQFRPLSRRISAASLRPAGGTTQAPASNQALSYLARTPIGQSLTVDAQGHAYVLAQTRRNNNWDLLMMKLNPTGTQLIYEKVIGGSEDDFPKELALDAAGNVYVTGHTFSPDLPGAANSGAHVFFRSDDGGVNWESGGLGLRTSNRSFDTLLVDPNNSSVIYAGASGTDFDTVFKSVDGGRNWVSLRPNLGEVAAPRLLAVQGGAITTIYVGASNGLLKSIDGGATWSAAGLNSVGGVNFMVIDPHNPAQLYAVGGNNIFPGGQVYRSADGAATWEPASNGLPLSAARIVVHLTIDQKTPTTLYAVVRALNGIYTIYRTTDGARTWTPLPSDFTDAPLRTLTVDPFDSAILYVGTARGIFKSNDGGQSWQAAGLANLQINMILGDPNNAGTLYAAAPARDSLAPATSVEMGVYKSTDSGRTWQQFDHRLRRLHVLGLAFDPHNTARLYAVTGTYSESFAVKLNADGATVDYAQYFGPGGGTALAVDARGQAYVAGVLQLGLVNAQVGRGAAESFVARFSAPGASAADNFTWAGRVSDLAFDQAGRLYVVGTVSKGNATPIKNGLRAEFSGDTAAFLVKLDPSKSGAEALLYGTYLEFSIQEQALALAVDAQERAYVLGGLSRNNSPERFTNRLFALGNAGSPRFLVQLDTTKTGAASLGWAAQLAPVSYTDLAVDAGGNVYLAGSAGAGYATTPGALQSSLSGGTCGGVTCSCPLMMGACPARCLFAPQPLCADAFVTKINAEGTALVYSTYLGSATANLSEFANDVALDAAGNVYLTGLGNLPATAGALQSSEGGFVAKLTLTARSTTVASVSAASFAGPQLAPESLAVGFLDAFGQGANNLRVQIRDSAGTESDASVLYSGPGQVNFQLPANLATGAATVRVLSGGGVIANGAVEITAVAPGVFAANASGRGIAAAVAQRVTADNTQTYEPVARYEQTQNQFVHVPIELGAETDQVFLVLFGTGWRGRSAEAAVQLTIGGVTAPVTYAGAQPTLTGVDQINLWLPRSLLGRGEVDVVVTVDGKTANTVKVSIK